MLTVSIFDNLNTVLHQLGEFFTQLLHSLRAIPQLLIDSALVVNRFEDIFPPFVWFLVVFLLSTGIIRKMIHWGG